MGSGLILLVIVGAWLAVLVPMALRSHDAVTTLRSAERFGDAMRVLSPRSARRPAAPPAEPPPALEPLLRGMREVEPRPPLTAVQRRKRVLLTLVGAAVAALLGGLVTLWLVGLGVVLAVLAVAYVVHLRRLALARAERSVRAAGRPGDDLFRVPGIPDRMPPRPEPLRAPLPAPAVRYEDPLPAAVGSEWSPVPVPPPVYAGKPVAARAPRTLDLTQPGRWSEEVTAGQLGDAPDLELEDILDGRRVVGGW